MSGHPADEAFLDTLLFMTSRLRGHCDRCHQYRTTVGVGHVETSSGPGYEIRHCRACVGLHLARERSMATGRGEAFAPALPPRR